MSPTTPYHDLVGGFAECRQDYDGIKGDSSYLLCAVILSLYPATLLRKLVIFDYYNELSFLEAEQCGVICRPIRDQLGEMTLKEIIQL